MNETGPRGRNASIAFVLPSLAGGGAERVTLSLIEAFLGEGCRVDLVLVKAEGELLELVPAGVRLVDLDCSRFRSAPLAFARYLRTERPDAVIANMWPLTAICALGRLLARVKTRLAVVEHVALGHVPRHRGWPGRLVLRATLAFSCRMSDIRIAVSAGVADDLAQLAGYGRDRITVIHNPVAVPPSDTSDRPAARNQQGGPKQILSVGRLVGQKNQMLLIEAFAIVARQLDARLVILGEGPLRASLEQRIAELELEHAVSLPGFHPDPASAYDASDLFVLSSDYEGFGNVIVEALAHGVPVVSTDCVSGPSEILGDGAFGTLVPCRDPDALAQAMLDALSGDHDRARLMARAADFAPRKAAEAYLRVMLGAGGDPASRLAPC